MKAQQLQVFILRQLHEYEQLMAQLEVGRAGDLYRNFMFETLRVLHEDETVFRAVVDAILPLHDEPLAQIELASEAIGHGYRVDEAVALLEQLATWTPHMTPQSKAARICDTAQHRLHNLLGYPLGQSWERPAVREVTAVYRAYFTSRAARTISLAHERVAVALGGMQTKLYDVSSVAVDAHDACLLRCTTEQGATCYVRIATDGTVLQTYAFAEMTRFQNDAAIVQTAAGQYGVVSIAGELLAAACYDDIEPVNDFFFRAQHATATALLNVNGQTLLTNVPHTARIVAQQATCIVDDTLYALDGTVIASLQAMGTEWEARPHTAHYIGFDATNCIVCIDLQGKRVPYNEHVLSLAAHCMLVDDGTTTALQFNGKTTRFAGELYDIVWRHGDMVVLLGSWAAGRFMSLHTVSGKWQFFADVLCTEADFVIVRRTEASAWCVLSSEGRLRVTERKGMLRMCEDPYVQQWLFEDEQLRAHIYLPQGQKLMLRDKLMKAFVRKNRF